MGEKNKAEEVFILCVMCIVCMMAFVACGCGSQGKSCEKPNCSSSGDNYCVSIPGCGGCLTSGRGCGNCSLWSQACIVYSGKDGDEDAFAILDEYYVENSGCAGCKTYKAESCGVVMFTGKEKPSFIFNHPTCGSCGLIDGDLGIGDYNPTVLPYVRMFLNH